MAHRNSWFTVLKNGDFPVRKLFTSLPEGILDLLNGCFYGDGGIMNPSKFVFFFGTNTDLETCRDTGTGKITMASIANCWHHQRVVTRLVISLVAFPHFQLEDYFNQTYLAGGNSVDVSHIKTQARSFGELWLPIDPIDLGQQIMARHVAKKKPWNHG